MNNNPFLPAFGSSVDMPSTAGIAQLQSIPVHANFSRSEINTILTDLLLPLNTPLSILAVELFNLEFDVIREAAGGPGGAAPRLASATSAGQSTSGTAVAVAAAPSAMAQDRIVGDPLGNELGTRRILRVSPLTPVGPIC